MKNNNSGEKKDKTLQTNTKDQSINKLEGIISLNSKGTGYVKIAGREEDVEVEATSLHTALNGDTVLITLKPKMRGRLTGEVLEILTRAKMRFTGVLEKENGLFFMKPDDAKMYTDILIPEADLEGATLGDKVYAEIVSWENHRKSPFGKIIKILGKPGDNDTEMHAIAIEKGFSSDLPEATHEEARKIKEAGIKESDYVGRRDFRKVLTFTIDPADAKDFDDAISFIEISTNEFEVGIHIADVSHYVTVGSALDEEARERGTSVYLVDRTIPMLPEVLSNDLCSLVPDKDRLTMSAVFILNKNAEVMSEWYGKTVIHSQKRFSYEQAEESIKNSDAPLHRELSILNNLAKKMTEQRFKDGAISLDQQEVKFVLDERGVPIKVIKKERGDSNRLIEEFMLLANRKVAEVMTPKVDSKKLVKTNPSDGVFIYRIHDLPSKEKTEDLAFFLKSLGYKIHLIDGLIPTNEINKMLKDLEGKDEKDAVHRAVIRSMAKAIYSTKNIGHYGLAFKYYTHFTSPIRRYPDIIVHRLLEEHLEGKKVTGKEQARMYENLSRVSSEQEKRAADAERSSIKYKQVEYMSSRIGEKFSGVISGITEWGIYVEEIETKCEGLVRVKDMTDDFYVYNEKKLELVGQKKKKSYRLGDRVSIEVKAVDLERKTIDYIVV